MTEEVKRLVPDCRHFVATPPQNWPQMRRESRHYRIGLALVLLTKKASALRRGLPAGSAKDPGIQFAVERHHLGLNLPSLLFWRGVPIDRIYLRLRWWPWPKRERSVVLEGHRVLEGRACSDEHGRVAVLTPYFPYPLAHGGAVRHLPPRSPNGRGV